MAASAHSHASDAFRHEALMYAGEEEFVAGSAAFVRAGLEAEEPVLVMVGPRKLAALREELGPDAEHVSLADMSVVGENPSRIIPAWLEFAADNAAPGRRLRGIGEPIWAGRTAEELAECHRHEALLNLAFADASDFWLLCPYDVDALPDAVIAEARRTHPVLVSDGESTPSPAYGGLDMVSGPFAEPLAEPPGPPVQLHFDVDRLHELRRLVSREAHEAGIDDQRRHDLILAVNEAATNSVRHGGGRGVLLVWSDESGIVCEVRDTGRIDHPLAGRRRPTPDQVGGFGLWLVNQVCDLVQIRALPEGSVVRLQMRRR